MHSLVQLLGHYKVKVNLVAPASLALPAELRALMKGQVHETSSLEEVLTSSDVVYQTRIQKERFASPEEYARHKGTYVISKETLSRMRPRSLLMHPLPRVDEITTDADADPRAGYFRQPRYGLEMRMAILASVMGAKGL